MDTIRIGMVGYKFMGKAHSNAFHNVSRFFDLPVKPVMQAVCGRNRDAAGEMAANWGWARVETDYRKLCVSDDIDVIDIGTPNDSHCEIALAAAARGKHIICEKPLARDLAEARKTLQAVDKAGIRHMVWFNYRRCPAIGLARKMITENKLGRIFHFRATYLQDWIIDPNFPLVWRLKKEQAGSGVHGDLNAHLIDLARYLVGDIDEVSGLDTTFIKERPLESGEGSGEVTVDDAMLFLARFSSGAIGSFEATRFAAGRKNYNRIEINGSKGSIVFNFERMNELQFYSIDDQVGEQGFRTIMATEPVHPYMNAWWPPGHVIGYEHGFVNQAADFLTGLATGAKIEPDFNDGLRCQEVLEAVSISADEKRWMKISEL